MPKTGCFVYAGYASTSEATPVREEPGTLRVDCAAAGAEVFCHTRT
jgi:hypothetical protein